MVNLLIQLHELGGDTWLEAKQQGPLNMILQMQSI